MEPKSETKVKFLKVNAEAARFRDLLGIYFSTKIKGSKEYIELHPDVNEKILERTSILFASVLVQKLLKLHAKLLALGYKFEELVNILFNENIFTQILINKLQGKLPMLDKESETYVSAIGCLDKRVDLDIKPVDIRYFPVLSAMASKVVYENKKFVEAAIKGQWKMELIGSYDFYNEDHKKNTTQAMVFHDKHANQDMIIVAFRGTEPFDADAWCTDFDISWISFPDMGKVHSGFMKAMGLQKNETWPKHIDNDDNPQCHESIKEKLSSLCFGKDKYFPENSNDKEDQKLHFGNCFLYDSHYVYKVRTKIFNMHAYGLKETTGELYEHYFTISPLALMKRSMDAIGKVWRSLISPNRESLPLLYLRYWGIRLWWAVDHNPQDYINAVRLGRKQLDKAD
ncbi:hypothetical protein AgCh_012535 [Apium graveolens]